jgi:predicted Na+-dependent transporter
MALRHWRSAAVKRHAPGLRRLSLAALALLIGVILYDQRGDLLGEIGPTLLAAVLYSLIAMVTGWGVGRLAAMNREDRVTLVVEFAARNLAITAVVGIMVLGRVEFVLFGALFFLVQVPILLLVGAVAARSRRRAAAPGSL